MNTRILYQILLFFFFQFTSLMYNSYATTITKEVNQKKQQGNNVTSKPSKEYIEWKNRLINKGYCLTWIDYVDLAEGESFEFKPRFCMGLNYVIIALPDDSNVQDMDIYIFSRHYLEDSDDRYGPFVMINYERSSPEEEIRVIIKNKKSNIPNQKFRCRFIVGYYLGYPD